MDPFRLGPAEINRHFEFTVRLGGKDVIYEGQIEGLPGLTQKKADEIIAFTVASIEALGSELAKSQSPDSFEFENLDETGVHYGISKEGPEAHARFQKESRSYASLAYTEEQINRFSSFDPTLSEQIQIQTKQYQALRNTAAYAASYFSQPTYRDPIWETLILSNPVRHVSGQGGASPPPTTVYKQPEIIPPDQPQEIPSKRAELPSNLLEEDLSYLLKSKSIQQPDTGEEVQRRDSGKSAKSSASSQPPSQKPESTEKSVKPSPSTQEQRKPPRSTPSSPPNPLTHEIAETKPKEPTVRLTVQPDQPRKTAPLPETLSQDEQSYLFPKGHREHPPGAFEQREQEKKEAPKKLTSQPTETPSPRKTVSKPAPTKHGLTSAKTAHPLSEETQGNRLPHGEEAPKKAEKPAPLKEKKKHISSGQVTPRNAPPLFTPEIEKPSQPLPTMGTFAKKARREPPSPLSSELPILKGKSLDDEFIQFTREYRKFAASRDQRSNTRLQLESKLNQLLASYANRDEELLSREATALLMIQIQLYPTFKGAKFTPLPHEAEHVILALIEMEGDPLEDKKALLKFYDQAQEFWNRDLKGEALKNAYYPFKMDNNALFEKHPDLTTNLLSLAMIRVLEQKPGLRADEYKALREEKIALSKNLEKNAFVKVDPYAPFGPNLDEVTASMIKIERELSNLDLEKEIVAKGRDKALELIDEHFITFQKYFQSPDLIRNKQRRELKAAILAKNLPGEVKALLHSLLEIKIEKKSSPSEVATAPTRAPSPSTPSAIETKPEYTNKYRVLSLINEAILHPEDKPKLFDFYEQAEKLWVPGLTDEEFEKIHKSFLKENQDLSHKFKDLCESLLNTSMIVVLEERDPLSPVEYKILCHQKKELFDKLGQKWANLNPYIPFTEKINEVARCALKMQREIYELTVDQQSKNEAIEFVDQHFSQFQKYDQNPEERDAIRQKIYLDMITPPTVLLKPIIDIILSNLDKLSF